MIKVKVDNKVFEITIPVKWSEVSYSKYLEMCEQDNADDLFLTALGLPLEIKGSDKILELYSFAEQLDSEVFNSHPNFERTEVNQLVNISPYKKGEFGLLTTPVMLPKDIITRSIAQYEDCKTLLKPCYNKDGTLDQKKFNNVLGKIFAIYLQGERDGEYDYEKAEGLEGMINNLPCEQVISNASFFLNKLFSKKTNFFLNFLHRMKMRKGIELDIQS